MRKRLTILAHFPFEPWPIRALCLTFGPTVSFGCMPSRRPRASSRSPPSSFPKCFSLISFVFSACYLGFSGRFHAPLDFVFLSRQSVSLLPYTQKDPHV